MLKAFKEFATRGNVLDLAIGLVMGAAFTKIIDSFVKDILMPPLSIIISRVNFDNLFISLNGTSYATLAEAEAAAAPTLNYGRFLSAGINFLIVAFALFLIIRQINRFKRGEEAKPTKKDCPFCISSIPIGATKCPSCTSVLG